MLGCGEKKSKQLFSQSIRIISVFLGSLSCQRPFPRWESHAYNLPGYPPAHAVSAVDLLHRLRF